MQGLFILAFGLGLALAASRRNQSVRVGRRRRLRAIRAGTRPRRNNILPQQYLDGPNTLIS